jgi:hypothetical protein
MAEKSLRAWRNTSGRQGIPSFVLALLAILVPTGRLAAQPPAPAPEQVQWLRTRGHPANTLHAEVVVQAPSALSVDLTTRAQARAFFNAIYTASDGIPSGWTGNLSGTPGVSASGTAGDTSAAFKAAVQLRINWFRAMAGVPADIAFDTVNDCAPDQQAALMMAANDTLSHNPPMGWLLYTQSGATAAGNSNISLGTEGPVAITGYISDPFSNNAAAGHRRWLLYPQTQSMGSGDVDAVNGFRSANATWILDANYGGARPATRDNFVAWPPPGYVPYEVVFPRWSFSYPNADFASGPATVTMTSGGVSVPVALEVLGNPGAGENTLVWDYNGLNPNTVTTPAPEPSSDIAYNVSVNNVVINGVARNFSYTVTLFDPAVAAPGDTPPTVNGPAQNTVGESSSFSVSGIPSFANGFEYRTVTGLAPASTTYGADGGSLEGVIATTTGSYNPIDTTESFAGGASYHLAQPDPTTQTLTLPGYYFVSGASPTLNFESWYGFGTSHQTAHVQISTDDGNSWNDIYALSGNDSLNLVESGFGAHSISLSAFAGLVFQVRFAYTFDESTGSYDNATTRENGWNIDSISLAGVDSATAGTPSAFSAGNTFAFVPAAAGSFGLQARAVMFGAYPLPWGPAGSETASIQSSGPAITLQPVSQTLNTGSTVVFTADASGSPTYAWELNGTVLSNSPAGRTSDIITGANGPQLVITNATALSNGNYTLVATNPVKSATSSAASLSVSSTSNPGTASSLSSRAFVGTGDNILIGGFYIVGGTSRTVLVQALGPAISAAPYNVSGTLQKPALSIHQYQNGKDVVLHSNTGWGSSPVLVDAAAAVYANPVLQANSPDSEILVTLPPGGYTAEVTGADGGTGVALCGIYQLP